MPQPPRDARSRSFPRAASGPGRRLRGALARIRGAIGPDALAEAHAGSAFFEQLEPRCLLSGVPVGETGLIDARQAKPAEVQVYRPAAVVELDRSYADPIVVTTPPTRNGGQAAVVRVNDLGPDSFSFMIDEWDHLDGGHTTERVGYAVLEAGVHTFADGTVVAAGSTTADDGPARSVSFGGAFDDVPVVFTTVVSFNDGAAVTTRTKNVGADGFEVFLQEEERQRGTGHAEEQVHWVAVLPGEGSVGGLGSVGVRTGNDFAYKPGSSSNTNDRSQDRAVGFGRSFAAEPVVFASLQTTNGADTAAVRTRGVGLDSATFMLEEETSRDAEVWHTDETLGVWAVEAGTILAAEPAAGDHRDSGVWRAGAIDGGGYVQNVVTTSEPGVLYAYVDVAGVYRSDDGGLTWNNRSAGLPADIGSTRVRGLVVSADDPDHLVIASGTWWDPKSGVHTSRDGGRTWTQTLTAAWHDGNARYNGFVLQEDPARAGRLLALSDGDGLFVSEDFGQTWSPSGLADLKRADHLQFDPNDADRVWAMGQDHRGWDGQQSVDAEGGLWRSDDAGATWTKLHDDEPLPGDAAYGSTAVPLETVAVDVGGTTRLIGIFDHVRVKVSDDGGLTWRDHNEGLIVDASRPTQYATHAAYASLTAGDGFVLLADQDGWVYRRAHGDDAWTRIEPVSLDYGDWWGADTPDANGGAYAKARGSLTIDPADADHWYATDWYSVWQTRDAGRSWTRTTEGIESTVVFDVTADPRNPGRVYAGLADVGFFRSKDGGRTFQKADEHVGLKDTDGDGDRGIGNGVTAITVSATAPDRLYALSQSTTHHRPDTVLVSEDAGRTWTPTEGSGLPVDAGKVSLQVVEQNGVDVLYLAVGGKAGSGGGAYRSLDGGQTWTNLSAGLGSTNPGWDAGVFSAAPWRSGNELAVSADGSAFAISHARWEFYAFDAAAGAWQTVNLWAQAGFQGRPSEVIADPHRPGGFYLVSEGGGLYESANGGADWSRVDLGPGFDLSDTGTYVAADAAVPGRVAIATRGGILCRAEAGGSWELLGPGLPERGGWNPIAFAGDRLVAGTGGSGVWSTAVG